MGCSNDFHVPNIQCGEPLRRFYDFEVTDLHPSHIPDYAERGIRIGGMIVKENRYLTDENRIFVHTESERDFGLDYDRPRGREIIIPEQKTFLVCHPIFLVTLYTKMGEFGKALDQLQKVIHWRIENGYYPKKELPF